MRAYLGYDSAWTATNEGAISAILADSAGCLSFEAPVLVTFSGAPDVVGRLTADRKLVVLAIDQPTIVSNSNGYRPVEKVAVSIVGRYGGGVQPSYTDRADMFGASAPIWAFLQNVGYPQEPLSCWPNSGEYVIEVYPCLNLLGLIPVLCGRGLCAKYNPDRKKTFCLDDWRCVCDCVARYADSASIEGLGKWAREQSQLTRPHKADQDKLDSAICAIMAYEWGNGGKHAQHGTVLGDIVSGYMFTVADDALAERLRAACLERGVEYHQLW